MRQFIYSAGRGLSLTAAITSAILYLGTFVWMVEPIWSVIPAFSWVAGCLLDQAIKGRVDRGVPSRSATYIGFSLLAFAIGTFIYVHKITNGATGVSMVDGHYVALYKSRVIGMISQSQYSRFPTLETRVLSTWCGMLSSFLL